MSKEKGTGKQSQPKLGTYYVPRPPCHTGNIHVLDVGPNAHIYGGGTSHGAEVWDCDVMMPCLASYTAPALNTITALLFPKFAASFGRPSIPVECQDGEPPSLTRDDWLALIADMKSLQKSTNFLVFCIGGHGRTGTVLSVLHGLAYPEDGDPVEKVRAIYCDNAVESKSQICYIEDITGIQVNASVKTHFVSYGGANSLDLGNWWDKQAAYDPEEAIATVNDFQASPPATQILYPGDDGFDGDGWQPSHCYPDFDHHLGTQKYRRHDYVSAADNS